MLFGKETLWYSMLDLDDLGCQTCNLSPSRRTELVGDNTVDTGTQWFLLVVEQDTSVVIESNDTAIGSCHLLLGAYDDGMTNVSFRTFCVLD